MANKQNAFGSRRRPKSLETTGQIIRRERLNKALKHAHRSEKGLKKLGIIANQPRHRPELEKTGRKLTFWQKIKRLWHRMLSRG